MADKTSSPSTSGRPGQSTGNPIRLRVHGLLARSATDPADRVVEMRFRKLTRRRVRRVRRVRIRVNARGAAYVVGLQAGRVYDAKIREKWPDTVWPQGTGLSHTCFLLQGMYEFVHDADAKD
jgi:hypothetical protein